MIKAFGQLSKAAMSRLNVRLGMQVTAKVQLVKDYGLILSVDGFQDELTGFIANEQLASSKQYKAGASLSCIVLDVDTDKKIIELSERLSTDGASKEASKQKENLKSLVEMNNERYLVVTLKNQRTKIGVCIL